MFTTDVLSEPVPVIGDATLHIDVTGISSSVFDLCVRLVDVGPDGRAQLVQVGGRRHTRQRGAQGKDNPARVGELVQVDVIGIAHVFQPGHRIGLIIAGADYPHFAPLDNAATVEIATGGSHRSWLQLPVVTRPLLAEVSP